MCVCVCVCARALHVCVRVHWHCGVLCVDACVHIWVCSGFYLSTALGAQTVPLDTPSKHLTMDAEPHGEEFEVQTLLPW